MVFNDTDRLAGVHPVLINKGLTLRAQMAADGFHMFFVQGVRTAEYQHQLWLHGRPGGPLGSKIVTDKDGYIHKSNHQVWADGYGHAIDLAFMPTPAQRDAWASSWPWQTYGQRAEALGLLWGGRWKSPVDLDHVEWRETTVAPVTPVTQS